MEYNYIFIQIHYKFGLSPDYKYFKSFSSLLISIDSNFLVYCFCAPPTETYEKALKTVIFRHYFLEIATLKVYGEIRALN